MKPRSLTTPAQLNRALQALADLAHFAGRTSGDPDERAALRRANAVLVEHGYATAEIVRLRTAYAAWEAKRCR